MEGIRTTVTQISHDSYHDNPVYHFEKEKSTARLVRYENDQNSDILYQITDYDATKILYSALLLTLVTTMINLFLL